MRIYVASSWRTDIQPEVVKALREEGHDVYDFRNPAPGNHGFSWAQVGLPTGPQSALQLRDILQDDRCVKGFELDMKALRACEACVLLQPSGRSAHLELGWAAGAGKLTIVYLRDGEQPDLMYRMCDALVTSTPELLATLLLERVHTGARR
jgi:hypothetical protein